MASNLPAAYLLLLLKTSKFGVIEQGPMMLFRIRLEPVQPIKSVGQIVLLRSFFGGTGGTGAPKDWIETAVSSTTNNFSVFAVAQRNGTHQIDSQNTSGATGTSGQYYLFGATNRGSDGGSGLSLGTNGISAYEHGAGYLPSLATWNPGNNTTIGSGYNIIGYEYTAKQPQIFMNGTLRHTGLTSNKSNVFAPYRVGGGYYSGLDGHITEALVFDRTLNLTEKVLVNNYLSSKYDLATAGDQYLGDTIANGDYDQDVFGVGRTSGSDAVLSGGNAGLNINNAVLDDNEFLLAGHGQEINNLIPVGENQRWERVFYLDSNGSSIDADLEFDFSDGDLTFPMLSADDKFVLQFADDSSLQWQNLDAIPTLLGDAVTFQLTDISTGYYTLAIVAPIPEPNSLLLLSGGLMLLLSNTRRKARDLTSRKS